MKTALLCLAPPFRLSRVSFARNRIQRPPILRARIGIVRIRPQRIIKTRIFAESQSSPTTTKRRTSGPPMTPPKDPNAGGGGGGGWGDNIARNIALNLGFLGLFFFMESTGDGGIFHGDGGSGGGGGGGDNGGNLPQEPQFQIRELGDSDEDEDYIRTKRLKRGTSKSCKQQKRKKLTWN